MSIIRTVNAARSALRRHTMPAAAAVLLAIVTFAADMAFAGSKVRSTGCVGSGFSFSCATTWRWDEAERKTSLMPEDPALVAEAAERERKWVERCKPQIRQDSLGVRRYHYAARGCEFGKAED